MNDDYLWDRSGMPDDDVAELERALLPLAHGTTRLRSLPRRPLPGHDSRERNPGTAGRVGSFGTFRRNVLAGLSVAATIGLVAYSAWFGLAGVDAEAQWRVSTLGGVPRVNDHAVGVSTYWRAGDRLETDDRAVAQVDVGTIGSVEVGPNSAARLVRARGSEHRMSLDRGSIRAVIWAPPGLFFVDTPSAIAVDLGCAYTLDVKPDGSGLLRVEHGWVGFRDGERESFIPQGAMCATRRGRGPGTPYYSDASRELVRALTDVDFGDRTGRARALETALSLARPRDALSVWHLLTRLHGEERGRAFDRLAQLAPPPSGVTREGVVAGNQTMLDAWWDTLGLESASWWRMWETPWAR
jgi:hypothetical protein